MAERKTAKAAVKKSKVVAKNYKDMSGPFDPDLKFDDLSKEFLLELINVYQFAWVQLATKFMDSITQRYGRQVAEDINLDAWRRMSKKVNPYYAKVGKIPMKTVVDSIKALQLPLDNTIGPIYRMQYEVVNDNHVIMTLPKCRTLEAIERDAPERIPQHLPEAGADHDRALPDERLHQGSAPEAAAAEEQGRNLLRLGPDPAEGETAQVGWVEEGGRQVG